MWLPNDEMFGQVYQNCYLNVTNDESIGTRPHKIRTTKNILIEQSQTTFTKYSNRTVMII